MKYDLKESTSSLIKKAALLYVRLANQHLKKHGIPHAYTPFLLRLWETDGQTQAMLHKQIGIEQPTAVRTLDRMERDDFITRTRCTEDRRIIKIYLTKKSIRLKDDLLPIGKTINDIALKNFTAADRKTFNEYLRNAIENIEMSLDDKESSLK